MSKRPIVKEDKPLNLTGEQIDQLVSLGLPVSLAFRDGVKKKIKKGVLSLAGGCDCCGEWIEFSRSSDCTAPDYAGIVNQLRAPRRVNFPNAYAIGILGSRR